MMEAATPAPNPQPGEYVRIWANNFSQVIAQITGAAAPCKAHLEMPADFAPTGAEDLWALITSSGSLRGEMRLRVPPATILHLAQIFMSEPVSAEAPLTADHRDALLELLRQIGGLVSTAARARWGEIQLRVEAVPAAPSWPPAETFWLQAGGEGPSSMVLEVGLSAALVAELRAEKVEAAKTETTSSHLTPVPDSSTPTGAMDRLMDVQLGVTMRFGGRRLLLREVLDLTPGAVVELDRRVEEPVDLLLDGKLVARGEVVVIDGNYGLRVTDASPLAMPTGTHDG
jgi:flagellar motor switch protein FliN/FliY